MARTSSSASTVAQAVSCSKQGNVLRHRTVSRLDGARVPSVSTPDRPGGWSRRKELCQTAVAAGSHIAHLVQEYGALHGIQLGSIGSQLREERIGEDGLGFFLAPAAAIAQQVTDIDFECVGEPLKRGEGGASLGILNLGDVGAGDLHSSRELTLAEVAAAANVANSAGNLGHSVIFWNLVAGDNQLRRLNGHFFHLKWFVAPAAE